MFNASCPPTTRSTTSSSCPATKCLQPTTAPSGPAPSRRGTTSAASSKPHSPAPLFAGKLVQPSALAQQLDDAPRIVTVCVLGRKPSRVDRNARASSLLDQV